MRREKSIEFFVVFFVVMGAHTIALVGRIIISGRPPMTSRYSSAVFIDWGAVLAGLLMECIHLR